MLSRRTTLMLSAAICVPLVAVACSGGGREGSGMPTEAGQVVDVSAPAPDEFLVTGVTNVRQVAQLTGPDAINDTEPVAVAGTDLGSMLNVGDRTYFVFGDTFGVRDPSSTGGQGGNWRSNAMAWTTDDDPSDGITFDDWIKDDIGLAAELAVGNKDPDGTGEVTKIPTYGFAVGDAMYLYYMSVHHWGDPGEWDANHAALARSTDDGQTWELLDEPKWGGTSNFIQVATAHVREDDTEYMYFWSIPAGRFGPAKLMKVEATRESVEDPSAYQYFAGLADDGNPTWADSPDEAAVVVDDTVGELSVIYHEELDRWLMSYTTGGEAVLREGVAPWGPWSDPITLTTQAENPGLYSPYMNPRYVSDDGRTIYFTLSLWGPYNVFWFAADLEAPSLGRTE